MNHGSAGWGFGSLSDVPLLVAGIVAAIAYMRSAKAVSTDHPTQPWRPLHTLLFMTGMASALLVTTGPVGYAAMQLFSIHMVQHIVLMMVATPLLVMGAPLLLVLRAVTPDRRRTWVRLLRSRVFAIVTNPILTWFAFAAVLVGIHFTPAMSWLMDADPFGRYAEIALYMGVAFAFYYTLLPGNPARNRPTPAIRVLSLFLMMIPETMTGFFLYTASVPLFPHFEQAATALGVDAVSDQRLGGALMWSGAMIIDVAWIAVAVGEWFDSESARTRRLDAHVAASVDQ
jgi:cytochrome c oxidase assembly factor CtaG